MKCIIATCPYDAVGIVKAGAIDGVIPVEDEPRCRDHSPSRPRTHFGEPRYPGHDSDDSKFGWGYHGTN